MTVTATPFLLTIFLFLDIDPQEKDSVNVRDVAFLSLLHQARGVVLEGAHFLDQVSGQREGGCYSGYMKGVSFLCFVNKDNSASLLT